MFAFVLTKNIYKVFDRDKSENVLLKN